MPAGISERLSLTQTVILDEADNLLDMGFKPTIDKIFLFLPAKEMRQTLLFSATVPPAVQQVTAAAAAAVGSLTTYHCTLRY